jgi:hypothetical protein
MRKALIGASLLAALSLPSCHAPKDTMARQLGAMRLQAGQSAPAGSEAKGQEGQKHPCETKAIPGGMKTHSYVLLQIHGDAGTGKIDEEGVLSQIFQFHVIGDLIRRYGVRTVMIEGLLFTDDLRRSVVGKAVDSQILRIYRDSFLRCVSNARESMRKQRPDLLAGRHIAEDTCISASLFGGFEKPHYMILAADNPGVLFTGFERDLERNKGLVEKNGMAGVMDEAARLFRDLSRDGAEKLKDPAYTKRLRQISEDGRYIIRKRSEFAIKEAVSRASQNTAVVIGMGYESGAAQGDALSGLISAIPFQQRPTFHFMGPGCQGVPEFFVSPDSIKAGRLSSGAK